MRKRVIFLADKDTVAPVPDPETVTLPLSPAVPTPVPIPMPVPEPDSVKSGKTGSEAERGTKR